MSVNMLWSPPAFAQLCINACDFSVAYFTTNTIFSSLSRCSGISLHSFGLSIFPTMGSWLTHKRIAIKFVIWFSVQLFGLEWGCFYVDNCISSFREPLNSERTYLFAYFRTKPRIDHSQDCFPRSPIVFNILTNKIVDFRFKDLYSFAYFADRRLFVSAPVLRTTSVCRQPANANQFYYYTYVRCTYKILNVNEYVHNGVRIHFQFQ